MRKGRLNAEAPLGLLGETHSVGRRKFDFTKDDIKAFSFMFAAPTASPEKPEAAVPTLPQANSYRHDLQNHQEIFDLDLDLNPDF